MKGGFKKIMNHQLSPSTIIRGELILSLCQSVFKHSVRTVLDFGFGEGAAVIAFARNGYKTFGYDTSKKFNALIKEKLNELSLKAFITHDWGKLKKEVEENSIDLVIMSDVYEHIENPTSELRKVKLIMSHNGHLYIAVPNRYSLLLFFLGILILGAP